MYIYNGSQFIKEGASIGIFSTDVDHSEGDHKHDFIEIVYILDGRAEQFVDGERFEVKRGDMLFINYGSVHSFSPLGGGSFSYANICFSPEVVESVIVTRENAFALLSLTAFDEMRKDAGGGMISFDGEERGEIESIIRAMLGEYKKEQTSYSSVLECYMNIIVTKMLRKVEGEISGESESDIWASLKEYIDGNLDSELTLGALARKSFYNPSYFSRLFKQRFGTSLTEYVRRRRIERAVKLLTETALSVDEISHRSGFAERSTFYSAFSRYTGKSPSDYRSERS